MKARTLGEVGELVARRRVQLQMDAADVTRSAGVDPKTYASLEHGNRWPRDKSRARIEAALQWRAGSLARIRDGDEPLEVTEAEAAPVSPLPDLEQMTVAAISELARAVIAGLELIPISLLVELMTSTLAEYRRRTPREDPKRPPPRFKGGQGPKFGDDVAGGEESSVDDGEDSGPRDQFVRA